MLIYSLRRWLMKASEPEDYTIHMIAMVIAVLFFIYPMQVGAVLLLVVAADLALALLRLILWFLASGVITARSLVASRSCKGPPPPCTPTNNEKIAELNEAYQSRRLMIKTSPLPSEERQALLLEQEDWYRDQLAALMR